MASAFKKLFRSADRLGTEEGSRKTGVSDSPSRQSGARRFFGSRDSPRLSRRDSKVSPLEVGPAAGKGGPAKGKAAKNSVDHVTQHNQAVRTRRLMREFQEISKSTRGSDSPPFSVELVDDNLYEWDVRLFQVDPESDFYRDMQETGTSHVLLNLTFPDNFPFAPPFVRVVSPLIEKGFVMEGGAVCMELLTPRGWASAYTVEAVVMQFAASLVKGQGRIARKGRAGKEFNRKTAEASFRSLVKTHEKYGWVTPPLGDG